MVSSNSVSISEWICVRFYFFADFLFEFRVVFQAGQATKGKERPTKQLQGAQKGSEARDIFVSLLLTTYCLYHSPSPSLYSVSLSPSFLSV